MITLIHGDDAAASRSELYKLIDKDDPTFLTADDLTPDKLILLLEPQNLLGETKTIVIEGLISRRESREKKELINQLKHASDGTKIVLWEGKKLRKTEIDQLGAQVLEFNLKPVVFAFLDAVGDKKRSVEYCHEALKQEPVEKLSASLASRLHLLLMSLTEPNNLPGQGFYKQKLLSQGRKIGISRVTNGIKLFVEADYLIKSGKTFHSQEGLLDIYLTQI